MIKLKMTMCLFVFVLVLVFLGQVQSTAAGQMDTSQLTYNIEAQSLKSALEIYQKTSGLNLAYSDDLVEGKMTDGVDGKNTTDQALKRILKDTGLIYTVTNHGTVVLKKNEMVVAQRDVEKREPAEEKEKKVPVIEIEDVVVRGEAVPEATAPSSATVITSGQIVEGGHYVTPLDMLKQIPGINMGQQNLGGTPATFQMRGFFFGSHGPDAAIYIDGIPLNESDSFADTNVVIPDEIERIEVTKGPSSALYGNYNSAGTIHFITRKRGNFTKFRTKYGSFNTTDTVFHIGREDGKLSQVYTGQYYYTDSYRDNSNWQKQNAAARWNYRFTDQFNAALSLRAFDSDWDAPSSLSKEDWDAGRLEYCDSDTAGGSKNKFDGKIDLDYRLTEDSKLLYYLYGYTQLFQRFYGPSGTRPGNERNYDRDVHGTGISYNFIGKLAGLKSNLVLGVDYMDEDEYRQRWYIKTDTRRTRDDKYENYDLSVKTTSCYFQGDIRPVEPLKFRLGLRYDLIGIKMDDYISQKKYEADDYSIFSPKGGVIWTVYPGYDLFANVGRGFALRNYGQYLEGKELKESIRLQYEVGARLLPLYNLASTITFFQMDTTDDVISDPILHEYINAGKTRRKGIEFSLDYEPIRNVFLYGDYAYMDAEFVEGYIGSDGTDYSGNRLRYIPKHITNLRAGYRPDSGFGGWLEYHIVSDMWADDPNTLRMDDYDVLNAQISYKWSKYALLLDLQNIADKKYCQRLMYFGGKETYDVANPFSAYLTFMVNL